MADAKQATRSKRVVAPRRFDKTQLRASGHGRTVHRDYAAHFFRWGWVARQITQGMKILDVGCGQDQPLLYVLGSRIQTVPELYVGVDLNNIAKKSNVRWSKIYDNFDFVTNGQKLIDQHGPFDRVVNFEVIEHMGTQDGAILLERFHDALRDGGYLYLSTPVFDGMAAANHVHEYTIPELRAAIQGAGFTVEKRIGTFASKPDIINV
jgi:2-polyprenyl-3-methyl-5-hydroxy-6-metoxy-1,4-benzoquinol methylase